MEAEATWHLRYSRIDSGCTNPTWYVSICNTIEEVQAIFRKKNVIKEGATVHYITKTNVTKAFI